MSGQWPPEWDDPDEGFLSDGDQPDPEAEARLAEVSACLAAVPAPALPDAIEGRISVALAAEASVRAADEARTLERGRRAGVRRNWMRRTLQVSGTLVVCLLFAGFGLLLSHGQGGDSSSSSAASASQPLASAAAPAPEPTEGYAAGGEAAPDQAPFAVTESGTDYRHTTLASQALAAMASKSSAASLAAPTGASSSSAAGSAPAAGHAPSTALRGCVLHFTGGAAPKLVDQARYQGTSAYVIASASRVWVVGPGCTATRPELIVSVPLGGLSGNLRALVSVKR
jgi:hypothetical protein